MEIASVLYSAGRGERLRPLSDFIPKPALPMLDVPLGAFGLVRLAEVSPPTVVNLRHLANRVTRALAPWARHLAVEYLIEEREAYGTAGTLAFLRARLAPQVVTINADLLSDLDVGALLAAHEASGAGVTLAVRMVATGADLELEGGSPVRLIDRRERSDAPGALFLGAAVWDREVLGDLPAERPLGVAEALLGPLAASGAAALYAHDGYALDVGRPARYLEASLDLLAGSGPAPPGGQWPGEIVSVAGGRAYLGPGAEVESDALGPGAIVLAGAVIGAGSRLQRAIVWPHETVPPGTVLADAIWARGSMVSAR